MINQAEAAISSENLVAPEVLTPLLLAGHRVVAGASDIILGAVASLADANPQLKGYLNLDQLQQGVSTIDLANATGVLTLGAAIGAVPGFLLDRHFRTFGIVGVTAYIGMVAAAATAQAVLKGN